MLTNRKTASGLVLLAVFLLLTSCAVQVRVARSVPTLQVVTAEWCGACQANKPAVEKLRRSGIQVTEYDVDKDDTSQFGPIKTVPYYIATWQGRTFTTHSITDIYRFFGMVP